MTVVRAPGAGCAPRAWPKAAAFSVSRAFATSSGSSMRWSIRAPGVRYGGATPEDGQHPDCHSDVADQQLGLAERCSAAAAEASGGHEVSVPSAFGTDPIRVEQDPQWSHVQHLPGPRTSPQAPALAGRVRRAPPHDDAHCHAAVHCIVRARTGSVPHRGVPPAGECGASCMTRRIAPRHRRGVGHAAALCKTPRHTKRFEGRTHAWGGSGRDRDSGDGGADRLRLW